MEIKRAVAVLGEVLEEEPEEGGFSDAGLSDEEGKGALLREVVESGQGLGDAVVLEDPFHGRVFLEGMVVHFEMTEEHGCYSFCCRTCLSS